jgi:hypothetical protein
MASGRESEHGNAFVLHAQFAVSPIGLAAVKQHIGSRGQQERAAI